MVNELEVSRKNWHVLNIPEGVSGDYRIEHVERPAGWQTPLVSTRCEVLGGQSNMAVNFREPTKWHQLLDSDGVWMTDYPCEQVQHDEAVEPMVGKVLVGGLGLGYAATMLARNPAVREVVVVEKSPELIELVGPHVAADHTRSIRNKVLVVEGDLFDFLETTFEAFDWGFYDIWRGDGERTFFEMVCPLRRLSAGKVTNVACWNENVMRGQLRLAVKGRIAHVFGMPERKPDVEFFTDGQPEDEPGSIYVNWTKPFFEWVRDEKPTRDDAMKAGEVYALYYGRPGFEDEWRNVT